MTAFKEEQSNISKRLKVLGGLPEPTGLEYVVQIGAKEGKSTVDFAQAMERLPKGDNANYTVVGIYHLPQTALDALNEKKRPTAGPAINERFDRKGDDKFVKLYLRPF